MKKLLMTINLLCFSVATDAQISSSQDLRDSLAPTGKLRASLYLGGPTNVIVHPTTGEMKGGVRDWQGISSSFRYSL